jgi:ankyrin repeat protein
MASSSKTQLQGKEANQKMSVVRQQVSTLLGAAMKGELLDLRSFLDDFAAAQLREERSQYGLAEGDASDDDDYPEAHFGRGGGDGKTALPKPSREERLAAFKRDAVRDFRDGNGRTAVHFAATSGREAVAKELLRLVPDAHALADDNGATALVLAAAQSESAQSDALLELLLAAGADVAAADKDGVQALHHAAAGDRVAAIERLVAAGAPLAVATQSGSGAPLHWAAGEGAHRAAAKLAELGAPLDAPNGQGLPPVIMAAAKGTEKSSRCVAALARAGADVGHLLGGGLTVLHVCADLGMLDAVAALVETPTGAACCRRRSDDGKLPVELAAAGGYQDVVRALRPLSFDFGGGGSAATAAPASSASASASASASSSSSSPSPPPAPPVVGDDESPTVEELMRQGEDAAAASEAAEAKAKADAEAAAAAKQANFIENTKPAADEAAAAAALEAKAAGNAAFKANDFAVAAERYTDAIKLDGTGEQPFVFVLREKKTDGRSFALAFSVD